MPAMNAHRKCGPLVLGIVIGLFSVCAGQASATGTVQVRQHDGSEKTYNKVTVKMNDGNVAVFSNDGKGTLIIGKSACARVKSLVHCLPYDAVLSQYDNVYHIAVKSGTLWLNTSTKVQTIPSSNTKLAPHAVQLSMQTKAGTSVLLTGTVDEVQK